jgi:hypothetical protein
MVNIDDLTKPLTSADSKLAKATVSWRKMGKIENILRGKYRAVSGKVYESIGEVLTELQKRGYALERKQVAEAMRQTDLHCPLSDDELDELLLYLAPQQQETDIRRAKLNKVLSGGHWRNAVVMARQRLGLPKAGVSPDEAIVLHDALLEEVVDGCPRVVWIGTTTKSLRQYWGELAGEARSLCRWISVDPQLLDKLRIKFATGKADLLIGLRKILQPEGQFALNGQPIKYAPSNTDRVMAHLLWGRPLSAAEITTGPRLGFGWERLPGGGGCHHQRAFQLDKATPSELRQLRVQLRRMKRGFYHNAPLNFQVDRPWKERWQNWNHLFPDLAFPSSEAMRKAVPYPKQKPNQDRLRKGPVPNSKLKIWDKNGASRSAPF